MVARWRTLLATLVGLFVLVGATTTTASAATFAHDVVVMVRAGVHEPSAREGSQAQFNEAQKTSASRSVGVQRTSTTPRRSVVATEAVRRRPGTTQAAIARTYEGALNPQSYIDDVVRQRGINLRGSGQQIQAVYNPNLASAGMSRAATPNVIEVGPLAMSSSDELARTLSHELNHARSWLKGGTAPEATAYAAEDALSAWLAGLR